MVDLKIPRGQMVIVRVNGDEESHPLATTGAIAKMIGADGLDTVILRWWGGYPAVVMLVDDTGMIDGRPVNPKATELYHSICVRTIHSIHGDVALVNDADFAKGRR